jgi:hypothetical protein
MNPAADINGAMHWSVIVNQGTCSGSNNSSSVDSDGSALAVALLRTHEAWLIL